MRLAPDVDVVDDDVAEEVPPEFDRPISWKKHGSYKLECLFPKTHSSLENCSALFLLAPFISYKENEVL
jgi:hypothetical protein